MRNSRWFRSAAALACCGVVGLAMTACGSSSNDDNTSSVAASGAGTGTAAATATGAPIRIGSIIDLSGPIAFPAVKLGLEAAVKTVNSEGGVNGHPLELVICDSQANTTTGASCGQEMVSKKVAAVVRYENLVEGSFLPILEKAHIPSIAPLASTPAGFTSSINYLLGDQDHVYLPAEARQLADVGARKIVMVGLEGAVSAATFSLPPLGVKDYPEKVTFDNVKVPFTATDMSAYAQQIADLHPDAVIVQLIDPQVIKLVPLLKQADPNMKFGVVGVDQKTLFAGLKGISDVYTPMFYTGTADNPVAEKYRASLTEVGGDFPPDQTQQEAYASVLVFAKAANGLSDVNAATVTEALNKGSDLGTEGFTPPLDLTTPVPQADGARVFDPCFTSALVKDSALEPQGEFINAYTGEKC